MFKSWRTSGLGTPLFACQGRFRKKILIVLSPTEVATTIIIINIIIVVRTAKKMIEDCRNARVGLLRIIQSLCVGKQTLNASSLFGFSALQRSLLESCLQTIREL